MELTKNTSVDPVKMLGKNYIEAVNAKFPNTILDEEWSTPNQVTLTVKTNMLPDVVEYLYYQHEGWLPLVLVTMNAQFMVIMPFITCFLWKVSSKLL